MNIIFFDGICGLCNWSVDLVLRADQKRRFMFCPLQSPKAKELIQNQLLQAGAPGDSILLLENDRLYAKSSAVIKILSQLPFPWSLGRVLKMFPIFLRDPVYDFVARHRYRIFGERSSCRMPTSEERERFLI